MASANRMLRLRKLIEQDCDGGGGEYEEFLPANLRKQAERDDTCFMPQLARRGKIVWTKV